MAGKSGRAARAKSVSTKLKIENRMASNLDKLAEFEEFEAHILPALRKDLQSGMTAEEIMKKYQAVAAARLVSTAMGDADSSKGVSASKDILDRTLGKAKESKEIKHKFEDLPEDEIDSLLKSKLADLSDEEEDSEHRH